VLASDSTALANGVPEEAEDFTRNRRIRLSVAPISYLETSVLLCDDNLVSLHQLPAECIDLIYLDPPFFSNRKYEVIWGDEAEMRSFRDRWRGSIQNYLDWIKPRVHELHRVLKPTGSLYFHCDPHASHYLKLMLDSIFGIPAFRNEIGGCPDRRGFSVTAVPV